MRAGVYADLPLSWYNHQRNILDPERKTKFTAIGKQRTVRAINILDRLLDKADEKYQTRLPFSHVELEELQRELGINLFWRRKLGSLDVVRY